MRGYSEKNNQLQKSQEPILLNSAKSLKNLGSSQKTLKFTSPSKQEDKAPSFLYNQYQTIHYVKIPIQQLDSQLDIYQWRKGNSQGIFPIKDFKLVSQGNILNPHALIKVVIGKTSKEITISQNITLSKIMNLLHEASKITQKLVNKFDSFKFTSKKITFTEDGQKLQIWPLEKIQVNPSNFFYNKNESQEVQITQHDTILSLLTIFQEKSLKTKLANDFFSSMKNSKTIQDFLAKMEVFQKNHNMFLPNKLKQSKNSLSTAIQKSSQCLEFSMKSSRKKITKCDRPTSELSPFRSLRSFYQTNNSLVMPKWSRNSENNYTWNVRSTLRLSPEITRQNSAGLLSPQEDFRKCQQGSFVFSEVFKDEQNTEAASPVLKITALSKNSFASENSWNDQKFQKSSIQIPPRIPESLEGSQQRSIKIDNSILEKSKNEMLKSQFVEQEQLQSTNPFDMILKNNGWSNNFSGFADSPTKQSFCDGRAQENLFLRGLELNHLKGLGRDIGKSMMPVQQDSFEEY